MKAFVGLWCLLTKQAEEKYVSFYFFHCIWFKKQMNKKTLQEPKIAHSREIFLTKFEALSSFSNDDD